MNGSRVPILTRDVRNNVKEKIKVQGCGREGTQEYIMGRVTGKHFTDREKYI